MKNALSWIASGIVFIVCFTAGLFAFKGAYAEGNTLLATLSLFVSGGMCTWLIMILDDLIIGKKE